MKYFKKMFKNISKIAFWTCLSISVILMIISFIMPPTGSIDPSVIGGVGELFGFAALGTVIEGMHRGTDVSVTKGDTSISLSNPDNIVDNPDITEG